MRHGRCLRDVTAEDATEGTAGHPAVRPGTCQVHDNQAKGREGDGMGVERVVMGVVAEGCLLLASLPTKLSGQTLEETELEACRNAVPTGLICCA